MADGGTRDPVAAASPLRIRASSPEPPASSAPPLARKIKRVAVASAAALGVAQLVTLVQTAVLARLLTPAEVGIFAAGTVLTALLADFAEGGMRAGLVHHGDAGLDDAAETVFRGTIVTGVLLSLGALIASPVIGLVFANPTAGAVAAATSGLLLLYSLTNVPEAMLQRQFSVRRRLIVGPAMSSAFAVTSVACALGGFGVWSLVVGNYASYVVWVATVWLITDWRPGRGRFLRPVWREKARYSYPLILGLLGTRARQAIESVIVGRFLSTAALGFYRYGSRISAVPVTLLVDMASNALFPAFSQVAIERDRLRRSYQQALASIVVVAVPLSGLILVISQPAVVLLLGEPWRSAGVVVTAMAAVPLGKAFICVSEEVIKGCGRTVLLNWYTAAEFIVGLAALTLIIPFGLLGIGLAISILQMIVGLLCLFLANTVVRLGPAQIIKAITPPLVAGAIAAAVVALLEYSVFHSDRHGMVLGLGLIATDAVVFVGIMLGVLVALSPATVRVLLQRGR